ncbi:MAG: ABC transporter permease, partial [Bacteroidota bacterium]|nr:FtsX-like permease family protein [Flammeovirgaceae bacterium]
GLFSLVTLNIEMKMKEIGIRKVLGASMANIAGVINFEFIVNLGIATVLGLTLGYFATDAIMAIIWEYYLDLNFQTMFSAVSLMLVIAFLAVGYKTISTALLNPTKTLRDE